MRWPLDRTGNQMRKQANEQSIFDEVSRSFNFPAIHIHDVGHFLKGVERYPWRKQNAQHSPRNIVNPKPSRRCAVEPRKKLKYLKNPRMLKFTTSDAISSNLRFAGSEMSSIFFAIMKSIVVDPIMSRRKRQSHHP